MANPPPRPLPKPEIPTTSRAGNPPPAQTTAQGDKAPVQETFHVDYVLVHDQSRSELQRLQNFRYVANLQKIGMVVERVPGKKYTDLTFIKLHVPESTLTKIAQIHGVAPIFENDNTVPILTDDWGFFKTPLTKRPNRQDPLFRRISESARGERNTTFTSAERILLINYMMARTRYGYGEEEYGLSSLLASKNLQDAYPLHDGPWEWAEKGPLNDRQLLAKFWANWKMFYKIQPIHMIHKYYGPEIAFHYAWLDFYTKMLIIPSILGICILIWSFIETFLPNLELERIEEVCESDKPLCPTCLYSHCRYGKLSKFCNEARKIYVFDNVYTIGFSVFITIWATFFLEMWRRRESVLLYKWNLFNIVPEIDELPEYKRRVKKYVRVSQYTRKEEHYTPTRLAMGWYAISTVVCLCCIIFGMMTIVMVQITIHFGKYLLQMYNIKIAHLPLLIKTYSAFVTVILMKIYTPYLNKISLKLTNKEYHRTKSQYMNSFILKSYVLSFVNSYAMVCYHGFFKSINYTYPGDHGIYTRYLGFQANTCPPSIGCVSGLSLHLAFVMIKNYILMVIRKGNVIPLIKGFIKKKVKRVKQPDDLPQWELEYQLAASNTMFFVQSFMGLVIEYGLVIFFVAAAPFLPLLALLNNIVELRITCITLVKRVKRNVPTRMVGLGAWNTVLIIVNRLSFLLSGCVIAFSSKFVHRATYYADHGHLRGFVNETVSAFLVDDYLPEVRDNLKAQFPKVNVCYYAGLKNPYNHPEKYGNSDRHYQILALQLVVVVVFIHLAYFINGVISFFIPKVPQLIRESMAHDEAKRYSKIMEAANTET